MACPVPVHAVPCPGSWTLRGVYMSAQRTRNHQDTMYYVPAPVYISSQPSANRIRVNMLCSPRTHLTRPRVAK